VAVCAIFVLLICVPVIVLTYVGLLDPFVSEAEETPIKFHLYCVLTGTIPFAPSVGVALNITPLHVTVLTGLITGVGLTYTVNVNEE
jgi:hypothetical protein